MEQTDGALYKLIVSIKGDINHIKNDVDSLKQSIDQLKIEQQKLTNAFPYGIEQHRKDHAKRKWFIFKK